MMRTTASTQPQIIIVVCCVTLRRSAYGAWGNYSVHDNKGVKNTSPTFIGHINPLRYRGYYYDRETRLYYLQSRYYDFANCRFLNADAYVTTNLVFSVCNDFGEQICGFGRCTCGILLQKLTLKWSTPSLAPEPEILTLRQRSWILKILSVIPIISLFVRVPYYFYRNSNYSGHMKYNCGIRAYILRTGLDEYALRLHKNNICSICKNEIQIAKIQKQSDSWFEKNQYTIFMSEKIEDREIQVILLISMFVDVVFYKNYRHLSVYKKERNVISSDPYSAMADWQP